MVTVRNPKAGEPPITYNHGVEVGGNIRTLYIAGQIGINADGTMARGIEDQTKVAYANLLAVLSEAGMGFGDIVKSTIFLVHRKDFAAFAAVRSYVTAGAKHASTLVFVSGLALPGILVEIEAIAVRDREAVEGANVSDE